MNEIKLMGEGWLISVKVDTNAIPEIKKKIYTFVQEMLDHVPSLNESKEQ